MLEERDLDAAVTAGVLDGATRDALVKFARDHRRGEVGPDEEQFRLLTGFNDIFVTIAVGLLLTAVAMLAGAMSPVAGAAGVAAVSWGLAEYFTRIKRMALPSIALLLSFVGGVFATCVLVATGGAALAVGPDRALPPGVIVAAIVTVGAAWLHWQRFMVPITVAAGAAALTILAVASVTILTQGAAGAVLLTTALCGIAVFALAMWFDTRDRARVTRRTDVAFWLHLLAAPLIVHPVFQLTGLTGGGTPTSGAALTVILVYLALTALALAIDRRALLVSALAYVIYAIQALVSSGGTPGEGVGLTTLVLGLFLVLLSAAWRPIRRRVLELLPHGLTTKLPAAA
ncbi:MAG TPA: hypothetical protein PK808_05550 [Polymorphobacter sp.]|nr:hypothetical protein [Polymorphobacter sp.]